MSSRIRSERGAGLIAGYVLVIVCTIAALAPSGWVILSSFKTNSQIFSDSWPVPTPPTLQGYFDIFGEARLHEYVLNTLLYSAGGTAGALVVAFLAAYPLARYRFRGSNVLVAVFSVALAIPVVGLATPEFFVVQQLGLFNSRLGLTLFYIGLSFPFAFVVLRAFLVSLPRELEEAAVVDGAGYFTTLVQIVLPLSRPAVATVAVVSFINLWNEFFFANLLTISPQNQNIQLALASIKSQFSFNASATMAGATIAMLVPIVVFLLLQRHVIAGLTAGATK